MLKMRTTAILLTSILLHAVVMSSSQVRRIDNDDEYFRRLSKAWSDALRGSVEKMEEFQV